MRLVVCRLKPDALLGVWFCVSPDLFWRHRDLEARQRERQFCAAKFRRNRQVICLFEVSSRLRRAQPANVLLPCWSWAERRGAGVAGGFASCGSRSGPLQGATSPALGASAKRWHDAGGHAARSGARTIPAFYEREARSEAERGVLGLFSALAVGNHNSPWRSGPPFWRIVDGAPATRRSFAKAGRKLRSPRAKRSESPRRFGSMVPCLRRSRLRPPAPSMGASGGAFLFPFGIMGAVRASWRGWYRLSVSNADGKQSRLDGRGECFGRVACDEGEGEEHERRTVAGRVVPQAARRRPRRDVAIPCRV